MTHYNTVYGHFSITSVICSLCFQCYLHTFEVSIVLNVATGVIYVSNYQFFIGKFFKKINPHLSSNKIMKNATHWRIIRRWASISSKEGLLRTVQCIFSKPKHHTITFIVDGVFHIKKLFLCFGLLTITPII